MKKNGQLHPLLFEGKLKKIKWLCTLTVFFFCGWITSAVGQVQTKKITLNLKNASMAEFVKEVNGKQDALFSITTKHWLQLSP